VGGKKWYFLRVRLKTKWGVLLSRRGFSKRHTREYWDSLWVGESSRGKGHIASRVTESVLTSEFVGSRARWVSQKGGEGVHMGGGRV